MPECTDAERAYLEACLNEGLAPEGKKGLYTEVVRERIPQALREKLLADRVEFERLMRGYQTLGRLPMHALQGFAYDIRNEAKAIVDAEEANAEKTEA